MRWNLGVTCVVAAVGILSGVHPADSTVYHDAETGFAFSQYLAEYTIGPSIAFRIALPSPVTNSTYDPVLQVVAPVDVGWAGLAWGGQMILDRLTIAWANGTNVVISSRYATGHMAPSSYSSASYQQFKTGTHTNRTHLAGHCQVVWIANHLAFAYSATKPSNPSSSSSTIPVHEIYGYWDHDFFCGWKCGVRDAHDEEWWALGRFR